MAHRQFLSADVVLSTMPLLWPATTPNKCHILCYSQCSNLVFLIVMALHKATRISVSEPGGGEGGSSDIIIGTVSVHKPYAVISFLFLT